MKSADEGTFEHGTEINFFAKESCVCLNCLKINIFTFFSLGNIMLNYFYIDFIFTVNMR